jgi:hypothetical protein
MHALSSVICFYSFASSNDMKLVQKQCRVSYSIDRLTAAFDKAACLLQPMTGVATRGHWLKLDSASLALFLAHRLRLQS